MEEEAEEEEELCMGGQGIALCVLWWGLDSRRFPRRGHVTLKCKKACPLGLG